MAAANFAQALALVLVHEGGKSDDPHDPGGRTNWGITHTDYDAYRKSKGEPLQDVYLMTPAERDDIYKTQYWDPVLGDDLPSGLDYVVFDGGVNSGISQSVKWLQRALPSLPANGRMTQALVAATTQVTDAATLIETCCAARLEFLQSLSTFQYFGKGWTTRVNDVQATALTWAAGATPAPSSTPSTTSQAKALRESAAPLPSTTPGDATTTASVVGIAATVIAHSVSAPSTPATTQTASANPPAVVAPSAVTPPTTTAANTPPPSTTTNPVAAPVQTAPILPGTASTTPATPSNTSPVAPPSSPTSTTTANATTSQSAPPSAPTKPVTAQTVVAPSTPVTTPIVSPGKPVVAPVVATTTPATTTPGTTTPATTTPATNSAPGNTTPVKSSPVLPGTSAKPVQTPTLLNPPVKTTGAAPNAVVAQNSPNQPQNSGTTVQPSTPALPAFNLSGNTYSIALIVLGLLFIVGIYLSISSRNARARRSDALGDNPIPKTPLKVGKVSIPVTAVRFPIPTLARATASAPAQAPTTAAQLASDALPIVQNVYARSASYLWIAATIVVNVIALATLLQEFGFAHENWHQPFVWLANEYSMYAGQAFNVTSASVSQQFGVKLPAWLLPLFVLYVSSASAFMVASAGIMKRSSTAESMFGAVIHAGWILAIPAFVLDAVRYHVVTRFARQNTVLFFAYIGAFVACYILARFINDDILPGFMQQYGGAAATAIKDGAAAATAISGQLRGY